MQSRFCSEEEAAKLRRYLSQYWLGMENTCAEISTLLTAPINPRTRILVHGYTGCGKTLLLRKMQSYFESSSESVSYLDIAALFTTKYCNNTLVYCFYMSRGDIERILWDNFVSSIVLIDNVDAITFLPATALSLLLHLIDNATNAVIATTNSSVPTLSLPYRFPIEVRVPYPDYRQRCDIFRHLVVSKIPDTSDVDVNIADLASRTQAQSLSTFLFNLITCRDFLHVISSSRCHLLRVHCLQYVLQYPQPLQLRPQFKITNI